MATIIKRKSKYSVVYYVVDENGVKRQKWESFDTNAAARKRKAEIEHQQDTNTFIAPSALTLSDLLDSTSPSMASTPGHPLPMRATSR